MVLSTAVNSTLHAHLWDLHLQHLVTVVTQPQLRLLNCPKSVNMSVCYVFLKSSIPLNSISHMFYIDQIQLLMKVMHFA